LGGCRQYQEYLTEVTEYLLSFFERTQPLQDINKIFSKVESEFEERWEAGTVQGWEDKGVGNGQSLTTRSGSLVDVDDYDSVEDLIELGPERLKEVSCTPLACIVSIVLANLMSESLHY
jgi:splicing factor 3A subunit 3